jgi:hypothetical protein
MIAYAAGDQISAGAANLVYATIALVATVWILFEIWSNNNRKGKR